MSWFNPQGDSEESLEKVAEENKRAYAKKRAPKDFWIRAGERATLVFLDDNPPGVWAHEYKTSDGRIEFTCRRGHPEDPRCAGCEEQSSKMVRFYYCPYSILDLTPFEYNGKQYTHFTRLLRAKKQAAEMLKEKRALRGKLIGSKWVAIRQTKTNWRIGQDWNFIESLPMELDEESGLYVLTNKDWWWTRKPREDHPDDVETQRPPLPYNYEEVLAPPSYEEMRSMLGQGGGGGGRPKPAAGQEGPNSPDDDIPF